MRIPRGYVYSQVLQMSSNRPLHVLLSQLSMQAVQTQGTLPVKLPEHSFIFQFQPLLHRQRLRWRLWWRSLGQYDRRTDETRLVITSNDSIYLIASFLYRSPSPPWPTSQLSSFTLELPFSSSSRLESLSMPPSGPFMATLNYRNIFDDVGNKFGIHPLSTSTFQLFPLLPISLMVYFPTTTRCIFRVIFIRLRLLDIPSWQSTSKDLG